MPGENGDVGGIGSGRSGGQVIDLATKKHIDSTAEPVLGGDLDEGYVGEDVRGIVPPGVGHVASLARILFRDASHSVMSEFDIFLLTQRHADFFSNPEAIEMLVRTAVAGGDMAKATLYMLAVSNDPSVADLALTYLIGAGAALGNVVETVSQVRSDGFSGDHVAQLKDNVMNGIAASRDALANLVDNGGEAVSSVALSALIEIAEQDATPENVRSVKSVDNARFNPHHMDMLARSAIKDEAWAVDRLYRLSVDSEHRHRGVARRNLIEAYGSGSENAMDAVERLFSRHSAELDMYEYVKLGLEGGEFAIYTLQNMMRKGPQRQRYFARLGLEMMARTGSETAEDYLNSVCPERQAEFDRLGLLNDEIDSNVLVSYGVALRQYISYATQGYDVVAADFLGEATNAGAPAQRYMAKALQNYLDEPRSVVEIHHALAFLDGFIHQGSASRGVPVGLSPAIISNDDKVRLAYQQLRFTLLLRAVAEIRRGVDIADRDIFDLLYDRVVSHAFDGRSRTDEDFNTSQPNDEGKLRALESTMTVDVTALMSLERKVAGNVEDDAGPGGGSGGGSKGDDDRAKVTLQETGATMTVMGGEVAEVFPGSVSSESSAAGWSGVTVGPVSGVSAAVPSMSAVLVH